MERNAESDENKEYFQVIVFENKKYRVKDGKPKQGNDKNFHW